MDASSKICAAARTDGCNTSTQQLRRRKRAIWLSEGVLLLYYCTHTRVSSEFKTRARNTFSGVSTHPAFAHDVHVPSEHGAGYRRHNQGFDNHVCRLTMSNQKKHTGSLCVFFGFRFAEHGKPTTNYYYCCTVCPCSLSPCTTSEWQDSARDSSCVGRFLSRYTSLTSAS